jgi:tyrosyl-tRNA synthetase
MLGRDLQRDADQEPQVCLTLPILRGLDGERRMGKSLGNYVGVGEPAYDQFAKTMSIPDALLKDWFTLLTDRPADEVTRLIAANPMEAKKTLGGDIATFYHGADAARAAREEWERRFSQRQDPKEIPEVDLASSNLTDGKLSATRLVALLGLAASNNEARRLILGGGVTVGPDRTKVADPNLLIHVTPGLVVRVGSRKVVRIRLT